jgi:hypothetical protein
VIDSRSPFRFLTGILTILFFNSTGVSQELLESFQVEIEPIFVSYCNDCHGYGSSEGGVTLDEFNSNTIGDHGLWLRILKNTRSHIMPPIEESQPTAVERTVLADWIKRGPFGISSENSDPGRAIVHRLNRTEYQNTILDLIGIEFKTMDEFPADNTGEGFDNIGELLTLSPMMLEKYLDAASRIVSEAVPTQRFVHGSQSPDQDQGMQPKNYETFFPGGIPEEEAQRREYTHRLLTEFATRAFRRPVDNDTIDRLVELASNSSEQEGFNYEQGVSQALVAILASPRFLFREESSQKDTSKKRFPLIDEYSLASRLSYFLWSTMPDEELFRLAKTGELRANLDSQIERMMQDKRFDRFIKNFAGQWLHSREIESVHINSGEVLLRDKSDPALTAAREKYNALREIPEDQRTPEQQEAYTLNREIVRAKFSSRQPARFSGQLKPPILRAMRQETEMYFEYVIREDRSIVELIDSDYTFLNQTLASHYKISGVSGSEMRKVMLGGNSPRGGVLTQGTILAVTSNPTRTSPVKRGVFILDNILGTPPAAPPPNIPALEDISTDELEELSLRETLALHREDQLCASCHNRMDPLGLALENFNAMGMWRESELSLPIDVAGRLITGEEFSSIQEMKRVLATDRIQDFYYCFTEKLLTYALGRGLEYYDTDTIDHLVETLMKNEGRASSLIKEIIGSTPFQKHRNLEFRPEKS